MQPSFANQVSDSRSASCCSRPGSVNARERTERLALELNQSLQIGWAGMKIPVAAIQAGEIAHRCCSSGMASPGTAGFGSQADRGNGQNQ